MVFMYGFGSVPFGVGLKGKEGHPLLECTEVPLKNKSLYIYIYIYIYIYKCVHTMNRLMKVSRPKNKYSNCAPPMVFMYGFGSVPFGVGLKGKEGHPLLKYPEGKISNPIFTIFISSNLCIR